MDSFNRDDPFPSWFANAIAKALSLIASQFILVQTDDVHVQVPAGADDQASVLAIKGLWRWIEASITIAHPGGAAGTYPIFATAKNNDITNVPDPFTDHTDYSFGLVIEAPGATPAIVAGTVDVYRHVGDAVWDGAKITRIDQWAPQTPLHAARHATGGPDALTPAAIGAVASGDAHTLQTGDLVASAATSRVGAVLCDGAAYSRTAPLYAPLFAKVGTRYGAGDGSTTFNVPNFCDRQIVGASATRPLGTSGGAETMALAVTNLPPHYHAWGANTGAQSNDHSHAFSGNTGGQSQDHTHTVASSINAGAGGTFNFGSQFSTWGQGHDVWGSGGSSNDHTHGFSGQTGGQNSGHTHYVSGNTDNGQGASTAFSLRDPYATANVFILL